MFQPTTEIGRFFNDEYQKLNDNYVEAVRGSLPQHQQQQLSRTILGFFKAINLVPNKVEEISHSLTALFEIDQSICGTFGARLFKEGSSTPLRKLLRDIISLWYRYQLLAQLERRNPDYQDVIGIKSFYDEWIKMEQVGITEAEYDRVLADVSMILENNENLEVETRVELFSMLGNILVTLGVSSYDAEASLSKYSQDIHERMKKSLHSYAEILLNLYVLNSTGINFDQIKSVNSSDLLKAIRYWSSTDEFSGLLFKSWNVFWQNDYFSPIAKGDELELMNNRNSIFSTFTNPQLKIGHKFTEYFDQRIKNKSLLGAFNPVPIFTFGSSGSGKSSFLTAFCYDAQMKVAKASGFGSKSITLGTEFQSYFQVNQDKWKSLAMPGTGSFSSYTFWEDITVNSYLIPDYPGKDSQPDQWEPQLQELFLKSKALYFFLDERDYLDPIALRQKAALYDAYLTYWMQSNSNVTHVPIGIILTKIDTSLGEDLKSLQRTTLIPPDFKAATIENYLEHRLQEKFFADLKNPYGRFADCILNDKFNNSHPVLQDIVQLLIDNFTQFLNRVISISYNYQIFLSSAVAPQDARMEYLPFGVREPIGWMANVIEKIYIKETLGNYDGEEGKLRKDMEKLKEGVVRLYQLRDEIDTINAEIKQVEADNSFMGGLTRSTKLKQLESRKSRALSDFSTLISENVEKPDTKSNNAQIEQVEAKLNDYQRSIEELDKSRRVLENRLGR